MQQKRSRLSRCHFQTQWWNLQAILQTRQQDCLYQCTIKPSTKDNQTITKNYCLTTPLIKQYWTMLAHCTKKLFPKQVTTSNQIPMKTRKQKENRKRNIIWLNPAYSKKCDNESWSLFFKIFLKPVNFMVCQSSKKHPYQWEIL